MDNFSQAYLNIIKEWNETGVYSLPDVAIAVKNATNNFKDNWEKGYSARETRNELHRMKEEGNPDMKLGQEIVMHAYEYWDKQPDFEAFNAKCKDHFMRMECPEDEVGLLAYAIWQGMKVYNFKEGGIDFKIGDKVELELECQGFYTSSFNYGRYRGFRPSSYMYRNVEKTHYIFTCEKYPNVKFDVVFSSNNNWKNLIAGFEDIQESRDSEEIDLRKGDKIKIQAKIKEIKERESTVFMNYGKLTSIEKLDNKPDLEQIL